MAVFLYIITACMFDVGSDVPCTSSAFASPGHSPPARPSAHARAHAPVPARAHPRTLPLETFVLSRCGSMASGSHYTLALGLHTLALGLHTVLMVAEDEKPFWPAEAELDVETVWMPVSTLVSTLSIARRPQQLPKQRQKIMPAHVTWLVFAVWGMTQHPVVQHEK